jgi:hypothetical protein
MRCLSPINVKTSRHCLVAVQSPTQALEEEGAPATFRRDDCVLLTDDSQICIVRIETQGKAMKIDKKKILREVDRTIKRRRREAVLREELWWWGDAMSLLRPPPRRGDKVEVEAKPSPKAARLRDDLRWWGEAMSLLRPPPVRGASFNRERICHLPIGPFRCHSADYLW